MIPEIPQPRRSSLVRRLIRRRAAASTEGTASLPNQNTTGEIDANATPGRQLAARDQATGRPPIFQELFRRTGNLDLTTDQIVAKLAELHGGTAPPVNPENRPIDPTKK